MSNLQTAVLEKDIVAYPKHLWFLTLFYCMAIILANWFDVRMISIFGHPTDAGTLIFPLTFLFSDLITEVYGYKQARRAIWAGFFFNLMFVLYGSLVMSLPSPDFETQNELFDQLHALNTRIIIASSISYFLSEPFNSYIMAKMKIKMEGKLMGIRFVSSTLVAAGLDSCIFTLLAFYGVFSNQDLFELIITMWFLKVMIEIIGLPVSIRLAKHLKNIERLDIYDKQTKFNIMSLDGTYAASENEYLKHPHEG